MLILRATQKVLKSLPRTDALGETSDTALGDWYVNRIVVDRRPLLLIVSAKARLSILEPARDVRRLPENFRGLVVRRLEAMDIPRRQIAAEENAMVPILVQPTKDKSILGQLVDFAKAVPYYLPVGYWGEPDLRDAEEKLAETPCLCSHSGNRTIWPIKETRSLLTAKWNA